MLHEFPVKVSIRAKREVPSPLKAIRIGIEQRYVNQLPMTINHEQCIGIL
jgi:hypothetical protein